MDGFTPVGGVEWCCVHHGIVDECNDASDQCDMADGGGCDVRALFYGPPPCSCPQSDTYRQLDRSCPRHGDKAEARRRNSTAGGAEAARDNPQGNDE